jgi:hypothetical protein
LRRLGDILLRGFPIEFSGRPTPFSAIRELALVPDMEEHQPIHQRQYLAYSGDRDR